MQNRQKIASNASMLLFLQIGSYVVPFLLLPYLSRTLGSSAFGELGLLWAISAYANIIVDFGFYTWATKEASHVHTSQHQLSLLYTTVLFVKLGLLLIILVPMILLSISLDAPIWLYVYMWITIGAQSLMPVWLYQGSGRVFGYLVFSVLAQTLSAILTVVLVKNSNDLIYVTGSSALIWSVIVLLSHTDMKKNFGVKVVLPSRQYIKEVIYGAWHFFVANVAISYYVNLPAIVLGFMASKVEIGVFMAANKLIFAMQALITPISAAIFPYSADLAKRDINKSNEFAKQLVIYTAVIMFIATTILMNFSNEIASVILGKEFNASGRILEIMAIGPMFVALSVIISNHILIVRGHAPKLKSIYIIIATISTVIAYPIIRDYHAIGAAWLYVVVEIFVFLGLIWLSKIELKGQIEK